MILRKTFLILSVCFLFSGVAYGAGQDVEPGSKTACGSAGNNMKPTQVCCYDATEGGWTPTEKTKCCGSGDDSIVLESNQECCGGKPVAKGRCCNGTELQNGQSCCTMKTLKETKTIIVNNTKCTSCGSSFLESGQECCGNQPVAAGQCCNGTKLTSGKICCGSGNNKVVVTGSTCTLCGTSYLQSGQKCCGSGSSGTILQSGQMCCDTVTPNKPYNPKSQVCCSTGVKTGTKCPELCGPQELGTNEGCCNNQKYNTTTEGCCNNTTKYVLKDKDCCQNGRIADKGMCPENLKDCNGEKKSATEVQNKNLKCCPSGTQNAGWQTESVDCDPSPPPPKVECSCETGTPVGCPAGTKCCGKQIWTSTMCCQRSSGTIEYY